jgi:antitoxin CptB
METETRRVLWRCRRGMKELDLLLERFAREGYERAPSEQKRAFARLLELPDPDLAEYFFGDVTPEDPELARLTQLIATHRL